MLQDVLQNLETIVSTFYGKNPGHSDFQVQTIYEAITDHYRAYERGSEPVGSDSPLIDHSILIRCLRKLQKSLPKWSKHGGRQGYLNFISQ